MDSIIQTLAMDKPRVSILLTVYIDSVKVELEECGRRMVVGWFNDEVAGAGAAIERVMIQSAILPELRKVPELHLSTEYRKMKSGHDPSKFVRATTTKLRGDWRRFVMTPGANGKDWIGPRAP